MQQQGKERWRHRLALGLIAAAALACGLTGIGWGLPGAQRVRLLGDDPEAIRRQVRTDTAKPGSVVIPEEDRGFELARVYRRYFLYSHHPDEMLTLMGLAQMRPSELDFNPRLFQYGGLFVYPIGALLFAAGKVGLVPLETGLDPYLRAPDAFGRMYLLGRLFVVAFYVATSLWVYRLAGKLADRAVALAAALLYLASPAAMVYCHEMKPHLPSAFFVFWMFGCLLEFFRNKQSRWLGWAALACGAAAAMLPTNAFFVVGLLCAVALVPQLAFSRRLAKAGACVACVAGVFLLCNPYALLDFKSFWAELIHVRGWYPAGATAGKLSGFVQAAWGPVGLPTILLAVVGWAVCLRANRLWAACVAGVGVLYCALLFFQLGAMADSPQTARWMLGFLPVVCVLAAAGLEAIAVRWIRAAAAVGALAWVCWLSVPYLQAFVRDSGAEGSRLAAGRWINENIAPGASIGVPPSPAPYKYPAFAFAKYRLLAEETTRPEYLIRVGDAGGREGYFMVAGFGAKGRRRPLTFADAPVRIYRQASVKLSAERAP